jgi:hypothetical protein
MNDQNTAIIPLVSFARSKGPLYLRGQCTRSRVEDIVRTMNTPEKRDRRHDICASEQPDRARLGNELIEKSGISLRCAFDADHPELTHPGVGSIMHTSN